MNQSRPATPGQILEMEFLAPYGITQTDLATHTGWTRKHVNQLCRGRVPVTVDSAFILAAATRTEPEYWLGLQSAVDLWDAYSKALHFKNSAYQAHFAQGIENDEALRSRLGQVRPLAA
nr:HigA family addiction module antitoxin [Pseudomonas aeruginosa]